MEVEIDTAEFKLDWEDIQDDYTETVAEKVAEDAPKDSGDYADGIGTTRLDARTRIVHNKGDSYRLGHVLEYGTANQRPQPHYRPNHKPDEYQKAMTKVDIVKK